MVFQSLLGAIAEMTGMGDDVEAQRFNHFSDKEFVPMHQAKVLDRSERLKEGDAAIRALASDQFPWLVGKADLLRKLLRVKVEDGNDLRMAADTGTHTAAPRTL